MAAQIIEEEETMETLEPFEENPEVEEEAVAEELPEDIPEKYHGKSLVDIIEMHREAEKLLGRQSSEVGELRKTIDQYIQTAAQEAPKEEEVDFFDDPDKAIDRKISNHPKIKEAEEAIKSYRSNDTLTRLNQKYPDLNETLNDNKFAEWIQASPIRTQLYILADQQSDFNAADELLGTWNERKQLAQQTATVERSARKQQLKEASTGNVSGTGESSRKVYRRSDIIKLMREDPDRYAALSDEIMAAYAEGRVK